MNPTFRIRCIPSDVEPWTLTDFLFHIIPGLNSIEDIKVGSFAPSIDDFTRPPDHTATARFINIPDRFKNGLDQWEFPVQGYRKSLVVDTHFNDFTPLNKVDRTLHNFDCISISGLGSHPFRSWKKRSRDGASDDFMWLRDQLPKDQPSFRVMSYGYDTKLVNSQSFQTIDHLALKFTNRLVDIRAAGDSQKPIIFLVHSLGGVILKRAFLYLANGSNIESLTLQNVRVAVLFGVPNQGMHIAPLLAMTQSQPNEQMVQDLSVGSPYLTELAERFSNVSELKGIKLIVAFETLRSATAIQNPHGKWERTGPSEVLVPKDSASINSQTPLESIFPINEDHSNIVKFSEDDPNYRRVLSALSRVIDSKTTQNIAQSYSDNVSSNSAVRQLTITKGIKTPKMPGDYIHDEDLTELQQSLTFEEIHFRHHDITDPQSDTFGWIFEKEPLGFVSWLQAYRGLYWIKGKPASGKSTLMKYLSDHDRVSELLQFSLGDFKPIHVWFFFHERGSILQKSYGGLLRSILLEVLNADRRLAKEVLQVFVQPVYKVWDMSKLEMAIHRILKQDTVKIMLTIFLDALDEYHGAPETIARVLEIFNEQPSDAKTRVKICFSSRPWDVFVKRFSECPGFFIHDYTQDDVRKYVDRRISEIPKLQVVLMSHIPVEESKEFIDTIVSRAEGVFLWVRLVLDSIKSAVQATEAITLPALKELLSDLPDALEEHFRRTIERIPTGSRYQALIILELLHRSDDITWLDELFYALACAQSSTVQESLDRLQATINLRIPGIEMSRQLLNLCGGLIELIEMLHDSRDRIQYIHRTVKDFLAKPEVKEAIVGQAYKFRLSSENGTTYLAKYWLTRNTLDGSQTNKDNVQKALHYANLSESTTGTHLGSFLDSIAPSVYSSWKYPDFHHLYIKPYPHVIPKKYDLRICYSPAAFAVCADLGLYLKDRLTRNISVSGVNEQHCMSPLHCVVLLASRYSRRQIFDRLLFHGHRCVELTRQILQQNPDLSVTLEGSSAFELLFEGMRLMSIFTVLEKGHYGAFLQFDATISDIASLLLSRGQTPNIKLRCRFPDGSINSTTPLHIAPFMARMLLAANVDVNVLDGYGRTPLDHWIIDIAIGQEHKKEEYDSIVEAVLLLIQHGGCMTQHGYSHHQVFMKRISKKSRGKPVLKTLKNPPILQGHNSVDSFFHRARLRLTKLTL